MKRTTTRRPLAVVATETIPDTLALQAGVHHRLARRLGVSIPVAAVLAGLAGVGPQAREVRA